MPELGRRAGVTVAKGTWEPPALPAGVTVAKGTWGPPALPVGRLRQSDSYLLDERTHLMSCSCAIHRS